MNHHPQHRSDDRTRGRGGRRIATLAAVAALVVTVTACGSDDDAGDGGASGTASGTEQSDGGTGSPASDGDATTADGSTPANSGGTSDPDDRCTAERRGGSVTMGVYSETPSLSPFKTTAKGVTGGAELQAIYDTLMAYDTETHEIVPRVAKSLTPNDDFSRWTLTLPADVEYGNGDTLTAADVKWNIAQHQDPDVASSAATYTAYIKSMRVVDDQTLVFTLTGPWADFPYILSDKAGMIVNPRVYESMGPDQFGTDPRGAGVGAYEPRRYAPGDEIVLSAKDSYWNGPVCLEELHFVAISGGKATYDAFRADDIDVAYLREPGIVAEAHDDDVPNATQLSNVGELVFINAAEGVPTADVRLRRAIAAAIDVDALDERVNRGDGLATSSIVHESSLYAGSVAGPQYDPELAKQLVDEVKAEGDWDGSIRLSCDSSPARIETALALQGMLNAVGFDVEYDGGVPIQRLIETVFVERNFEIACWGWSAGDDDPYLQLDQNLRSDSPFNASSYHSPEMDELLIDLREASTVEDRARVIDAMQEVWNETVPSAITSAAEEMVIWKPELHGVSLSSATKVVLADAYLDG